MKPWRLDCRFFLGDRPRKFKRVCEGCGRHSPMGKRILIVKLSATGDVLRATPRIGGLKRAYPRSHLTWGVDREARPLLEHNPLIDRLLTFDFPSLLPLEAETFDLAIGLEKEPRGAALNTGCDNPPGRFAALTGPCDLVVPGDTAALHLAVGLKKTGMARFGPARARETELYGRGKKILTSLSCAPSYRRTGEVSPDCMEALSAGEAMGEIRPFLSRPGRPKA